MTLMHVRLELAREPDFPEGSALRGYDFNAPLNEDGTLNLEEWREKREYCTVRRFWPQEEELHGHLTHNGSHWKFHYMGTDPDEDEPIYKLSSHPIRQGEYLSITEQDGEQRTFRIVIVRKSPLEGG